MDYNVKDDNLITLPLIALRGIVVLPGMSAHFEVGRKKSLNAVTSALAGDKRVLLVTQRDIAVSDPTEEDLYEFGVIATIRQVVNIPGNTARILVEGESRAYITAVHLTKESIIGNAESIPADFPLFDATAEEALIRTCVEAFERYSEFVPKISGEIFMNILSETKCGKLADYITSNIMVSPEKKQEILEAIDPQERINMVINLLTHEVEVLALERDIKKRVNEAMEKNQKEYYLREQVKAIYEELGEGDNPVSESDKYIKRIKALKLAEKAEEHLINEAKKLAKMQTNMPDYSVHRAYLELCLDLPWNTSSKDIANIKKVQDKLEKDHYGLSKVKERIIEYIAVMKLSGKVGSQVLCLIGPPGVGKTSVASSIAAALGRKFVRISLGGVSDESEIRGHRKTYIGAMPGRIISAFKQAGTNNPVILLDEIDKLGRDYKGDPANAMLEVLDCEQNKNFRDNYLEIPFDISKAIFITTANSADTIPRPLMDRMEIIRLNSYTDEEKFEIGKRYIIPKQLEKNALDKKDLKIDDDALKTIVTEYDRESGVRNLERFVSKICRKAALIKIKTNKKCKVNTLNIEEFLGPKKISVDMQRSVAEIGIANGLAWTEVGGEALKIEVSVMDGQGKIQLTGSLGDVMKESANAAVTYIRANADRLHVDKDFYKNKDIHIHVPEGAVPKDGPSAGITMATALLSALTGVAVKGNIAMTGEITLRGNVLPIGGLNEKLSAAVRMKFDTVIIPADNISDVTEVDKNVTSKLNIIPVSNVNEVFELALVSLPGGASEIKAEEYAVPQNPIHNMVENDRSVICK